MCFSSVDRSCVKLFLFSTVLLNITFLNMGFIVVLWENENIVSVIKEKKVVGALELKEGTTRLSRSLSLRELLHYEHFLHA